LDNEELQVEKLSRQQVFDVTRYLDGFYGSNFGHNYGFYDSQLENKNLIGLNNNPKIPTYENLKKAVANYEISAEVLQDYSEFMYTWDSLYSRIIDLKVGLLAFDRYEYCTNMVDPEEEMNSKEYKADKRRVKKFFQRFNDKQEFLRVAKNVMKTDTYFTWLRDSSGSFDDDPIELEEEQGYNVKRASGYGLQMMPQEYCRITGEFVNDRGVKGYLWDFNLDYFAQASVNIENYDPSLIASFNEKKKNGQLKSYINNNIDLNKTNDSFDGYVRTKVNSGSWCFKFNTDNFNAIPPLTSLLMSSYNNDVVESLQKDKDMISAYAIIAGEIKTRKEGNEKNAMLLDDKEVGRMMKLARMVANNDKIKQIPYPLEELEMFQFTDGNASMAKNQFVSTAKKGTSASSLIYASEKMGEMEFKSALNADFNNIASVLYPQFENFLNFFVNKKTKKYKFKFKICGSTIPFLRQADLDNHIKLSDKGLQVSPSRWGSLLGYSGDEFETLMAEAKYGNMQELSFLLLNANTTAQDGSGEVGNPIKDDNEISESGSTSRLYG
jgi:hypothetical protein